MCVYLSKIWVPQALFFQLKKCILGHPDFETFPIHVSIYIYVYIFITSVSLYIYIYLVTYVYIYNIDIHMGSHLYMGVVG